MLRRKKNEALISSFLVTALCIICSMPAIAADTQQNYDMHIARDLTNVPRYTTPDGEPTTPPELPDNVNSVLTGASPRMLAWAAYQYDNTKYTRDEFAFKLGQIYGDNTAGYEMMVLDLTLSITKKISGTITAGGRVGAELELIVGKANAELSASVSSSITYEKNYVFKGSTGIPVGKKGALAFYNAGYNCAGTMTYSVLDTSTDKVWYEKSGIGALVPIENEYGCKFVP